MDNICFNVNRTQATLLCSNFNSQITYDHYQVNIALTREINQFKQNSTLAFIQFTGSAKSFSQTFNLKKVQHSTNPFRMLPFRNHHPHDELSLGFQLCQSVIDRIIYFYLA